MASHATSNDDQVIVVLDSSRLGDDGLADASGSASDHVPPAFGKCMFVRSIR